MIAYCSSGVLVSSTLCESYVFLEMPFRLFEGNFEPYCSAPHALLAMGKVDPMHPDLAIDPLGILRPASKLTHQLPLVNLLFIIAWL